MKRIVSITLWLLVAGLVATAAPVPCNPNAPGTVTTVVGSLPGTSLMTINCGPVTFSNFQAQDASGGTTMGLPINYIAFMASYWDPVTGIANIAFNPNFSNSDAVQDIHFFFNVASTAPIIGIDMNVGGVGVGMVNEKVCNGGVANVNIATGNCITGANVGGLTVGLGGIGSAPLNGAYTNLGIWKDVGKTSGGLTGFTQSFQTVPEPTTFVLLGGGLIALALFRRKRA